jgi:hypothetical protein
VLLVQPVLPVRQGRSWSCVSSNGCAGTPVRSTESYCNDCNAKLQTCRRQCTVLTWEGIIYAYLLMYQPKILKKIINFITLKPLAPKKRKFKFNSSIDISIETI